MALVSSSSNRVQSMRVVSCTAKAFCHALTSIYDSVDGYRQFAQKLRPELNHPVCRQQIMQQYATHLSDGDIAELARATDGMSGRDLRDIAEQTERRTASKVSRSRSLSRAPTARFVTKKFSRV